MKSLSVDTTSVPQAHWSRRSFVCRSAALAVLTAFEGRPLWASDTPLSPSTGGKSISRDALQKGDIILSTTSSSTTKYWRAALSALRRAATGGGPVSHAAIYSDLGVVDVLISTGVTVRSLEDSLADASVAAAFRFPRISSDKQQALSDWSVAQIGGKYAGYGSISEMRVTFLGQTHRLVNLGSPSKGFYCSEFVIDAYKEAGLQLTTTPPSFASPNDLVPLTWFGELECVGHLKA